MIESEFKELFGIPSKLPIIPGHEITGVIEELGSSATGFQKGDRVGVQVLWKTDGTCEFCQTASMGKLKVDCVCYKLSEAEDVLLKLKQGKIVGRAVLVP